MRILRQVLESISNHARRSLPFECCGILLASCVSEPIVSCALWAENDAEDRPEERYVLCHKAHLRAIEMEESGNVRIAGYYHSHPGGRAQPSRWDIEQAIDGVAYLIIGLKGDGPIEYAVWRFEGDNPVPEPLEVSE